MAICRLVAPFRAVCENFHFSGQECAAEELLLVDVVAFEVGTQQVLLPHADRGEFAVECFGLFAVVEIARGVSRAVAEQLSEVD